MSFKSRLQTHSWFIAINALVLMAIASRYFAFLPSFPTEPLGITFIVVSIFSQMALLAAIVGLVTLPLLLLPTKLRQPLLALIASVGVITLFIDTIVFAQYRFHINAMVLDLILAGQIVSFPLITWLMVIGGVIACLAAQWGLLTGLSRTRFSQQRKVGKKFALLTFLTLLATHGIHIWAAAYAYQPVTTVKRYLPLFYPATANSMMRKNGWIDEQALARQKAMDVDREADLNYPLSPLSTTEVEQPVNIMFLVVDSWRADTFNADNTPNLWALAQDGRTYSHHLATGNATRTGIFGLFYGMPGTYWHSFLANQQSPMLMDRLQALDYQLGVFTATQLEKPEFNQTVFAKVSDLRNGSEGDSPAELDADLTQDWIRWHQQRDPNRPTFSFLFYDAPHGYDFPADFTPKYQPMLDEVNYLKLDNETDPTPFFNRYKTSVRYVDSLVAQVVEELKQSGEFNNTLLVLTGDHGQEMNDNQLNFWGHNSNFTDPQIHVPFAMIGPGINAKQVDTGKRLTSHQDVAPTLMKHYLGVTSDPASYAIGHDLLAPNPGQDWVLSSNYSGYALVTDDTILEVGAGGQYQYMDNTNRPIENASPDFAQMEKALEQISRFR
ncbi:DUF3413 domain-containing protein [Salinivibrio sp. HTSP]|uniref:DUF3413 domain-containing protein n=1 Tax=Salinivibrio sp. HTSP TaxID=2115977 RepID=UPI000E31C019|nr:DUF3413 domain-containing protein [Salinivibrio sp. HTSP]